MGRTPRILVDRQRIAIVAPERTDATRWKVSFLVGDALFHAMREGDALHLARSWEGGIGISLIRTDRLVLALGAVTVTPLGDGITVERGSASPAKRPWEPVSDTWLEVTIGTDRKTLRHRQSATVGGYDVYVEHGWIRSLDGRDECVAIASRDYSGFRDVAMRSAILLAAGSLRMTGWEFFGTPTD